jgi:CheY-like chemotaxis protein
MDPMNKFSLFRKQVHPVAVPTSRPCPTAGASQSQADVQHLVPRHDAEPSRYAVPPEPTATPYPDMGRGSPAVGLHTLVLADDHQVVRQSLKRLLNQQPGLQLVGESGNGLETLVLVKQLQPDLLVTDLMMPGMNGLEVTRRVRLSFPCTRVVVVSSNGDEPYVAGALRCGADGFVLKSVCARYLLAAVRAVLAGERFVSPPLVDPMR